MKRNHSITPLVSSRKSNRKKPIWIWGERTLRRRETKYSQGALKRVNAFPVKCGEELGGRKKVHEL